MSVEELKTWLDKRARGEAKLELIDVRTPQERELARIEGARAMGAETERALEDADKGAMLVFHCHHGMRSRSAAEHYLREGFRNVWNVEGGIDAWSQRVDTNVPRYG
jgi:monothiol glutaredoxin